jgi:hypothetical protein
LGHHAQKFDAEYALKAMPTTLSPKVSDQSIFSSKRPTTLPIYAIEAQIARKLILPSMEFLMSLSVFWPGESFEACRACKGAFVGMDSFVFAKRS